MSLLVLSATDVKNIIPSFDTIFLQNLMAQVFVALSRSTNAAPKDGDPEEADIQTPHRTSINMRAHNTLFMPARLSLPRVGLNATSIKIVSIPLKEDDMRGLPGTTLVLNEETGAIEAVVNARELTALRNAAGSLLSTTLVGVHEPKHLVMFGAGKQIEAHITLFLRHYPNVQSCAIINRNINERAQTLHRTMAQSFNKTTFQLLSLHDSIQVRKTVETADVIICATSSTSPLFQSSWVSSGTHVILIGSYKPNMQEVEEDLVRRALSTDSVSIGRRIDQILLVDSRDACMKEAGDLIKAGIGPESMLEIGELLLRPDGRPLAEFLSQQGSNQGESNIPSRTGFSPDGPITLFKSVGVGLQDVVMAKEVVSHAKNIPNVGTRIDNYDTLAT